MGRAEHRKMQKSIRKRMTDEQFNKLQVEANKGFVEMEVNKQIKFYQNLWTECMLEAFKNNGLSQAKAKMVLDDIELIMLRKIEEKKNSKGVKPVVKGRL